MRRYLQQGCRQLVAVSKRHDSLVVFLFSTLVYLLTMDHSASWWDCGEFITTGWGLQIGHPPGAPFYQLVTHCAMLLSFGNPMWVAPLSNLVSVLCASFTVLLLYKTILLLLQRSNWQLAIGNWQQSVVLSAISSATQHGSPLSRAKSTAWPCSFARSPSGLCCGGNATATIASSS